MNVFFSELFSFKMTLSLKSKNSPVHCLIIFLISIQGLRVKHKIVCNDVSFQSGNDDSCPHRINRSNEHEPC